MLHQLLSIELCGIVFSDPRGGSGDVSTDLRAVVTLSVQQKLKSETRRTGIHDKGALQLYPDCQLPKSLDSSYGFVSGAAAENLNCRHLLQIALCTSWSMNRFIFAVNIFEWTRLCIYWYCYRLNIQKDKVVAIVDVVNE